MGQSAEAIVFFGHAYEDENTYPWQDPMADEDSDEDADDRFARLTGTAGLDYSARNVKHQASGCQIVVHCTGDYPCYGVALNHTIKQATQGNREALVMADVTSGDLARLAAYCDLMGIKPTEEPRWWIVAYYG